MINSKNCDVLVNELKNWGRCIPIISIFST